MNIPDVKAVVDTVSLRRRDGTHFRARISASKVVDNTPIPICLVIIVLPETNPHPDIVQPNVEIEPRNKEQTASSG
ncbi:hypothetical protein SARC_10190 [Sphaeroforma arctica JP610]|uniref:Uncharacterized protein n=1 Tax=Sphaeroforma arctica JP610 TaxID=667725 RepID=A0A0L0FKN5_9EUKA|nr:hypothetical protein SARC_10190 [Sphaeroforma arctica JP610]KNC77347.1 hypothetical protein SARC_10190 [Sphaeroforma arctica JP610]|eukprot:XP_014151249.1 hypothetical protein SARC_10190 [Sphaeroforma arctica JP610]